MASGWEAAPFDDSTWEKWACNDMYRLLEPSQLQAVTRWFELHKNSALTRSRRPSDHWDRLRALKIPVYGTSRIPVSRRRQLPLDRLRAMGRSYYTCTFAYQIALALLEGVQALALYGVALTGSREAIVERPCVEWWLGYAEGRGVTVTVHPTNEYGEGLLQAPYRYAVDDPHERRHAYLCVERHHLQSVAWLQSEYCRLIMTTPPRKDQLIDAELDRLVDATRT